MVGDVLVFAVPTSPTAEETFGSFEGVEPPLSSKVSTYLCTSPPIGGGRREVWIVGVMGEMAALVH